MVTERQYRYLLEQYARLGWRTKGEPVEIEPEKPGALRQMAELVCQGKLDFELLSDQLAVNVSRLKQLLAEYAPKPQLGELTGKVIRLHRRRL